MKRTALRRQSKKRAKESVLYLRLRHQFLLDNRCCHYPECLNDSQDVHHKMGRGKYYLEEKYWMALCPRHHRFIEDNKNWARSAGYILYR